MQKKKRKDKRKKKEKKIRKKKLLSLSRFWSSFVVYVVVVVVVSLERALPPPPEREIMGKWSNFGSTPDGLSDSEPEEDDAKAAATTTQMSMRQQTKPIMPPLRRKKRDDETLTTTPLVMNAKDVDNKERRKTTRNIALEGRRRRLSETSLSGTVSNSDEDEATTREKKRPKEDTLKRRKDFEESDDDDDDEVALRLVFEKNRDVILEDDPGLRTTKTTNNNASASSLKRKKGTRRTENSPAKQRQSKSKKELTFEERLRRNKEEQEREAKRNAEEQKMLERHAQQTKEMEEEEENEELNQEHANETYRRMAEREKEDKLFQELDERPEPNGRMKTIANKALMKKTAEGGGYNEEYFEGKLFEVVPDGPLCKAFMQKAKEMNEHMNLCAEFLLGRWLRYAEKSKICDDPNAIFPWLLNVITSTSRNKEIIFAARDALIFALYENERRNGNNGMNDLIGSWYGDNMDTLANTSFEALLVVVKEERAWRQKRRSGIGGGTPAKKAMENSKGRDVIIVLDGEDSKTKLDGEDSKTTTLKTETPTKISGTWSAQDALKALKKVGIDDSFPASEYDLMVKPSNLTGRKKKNAKKEKKEKVFEERPDVSVNVSGVVSAIRALSDYNYLQDEAPLTNAKNGNFDADGCSEIIKLIAKVRLDPRSDASGACFDACVKSIVRCVSSCNTIDAASKKQFSMKLSQNLANVVGNDSSSPAITFILRWFPVHDAFSAFIRDGLALYGFRGCLKRIENGPPPMTKRKDEDDDDEESEEETLPPSPMSPVDASLDVEAFRVSFECSLNLIARTLVGDALFSARNPEFNNPDDVWQFVRLWDFADCVLKGGVSANVTEAVTEGDSGLQKASKWISKLKTLIPKQSNKEAVAQFRSRVNDAQNWYNQEAHARALGENIGGDRVKFNEIEIE